MDGEGGCAGAWHRRQGQGAHVGGVARQSGQPIRPASAVGQPASQPPGLPARPPLGRLPARRMRLTASALPAPPANVQCNNAPYYDLGLKYRSEGKGLAAGWGLGGRFWGCGLQTHPAGQQVPSLPFLLLSVVWPASPLRPRSCAPTLSQPRQTPVCPFSCAAAAASGRAATRSRQSRLPAPSTAARCRWPAGAAASSRLSARSGRVPTATLPTS